MSERPFWQRALRYMAESWGFWGVFALLMTLLLALYAFNVPVAELVAGLLGG